MKRKEIVEIWRKEMRDQGLMNKDLAARLEISAAHFNVKMSAAAFGLDFINRMNAILGLKMQITKADLIEDAIEMNIEKITYTDKTEKELDEVVMHNVDMVHVERMDDGHIWVALYSGDQRLVLNYYTQRNGKILGSAERNA